MRSYDFCFCTAVLPNDRDLCWPSNPLDYLTFAYQRYKNRLTFPSPVPNAPHDTHDPSRPLDTLTPQRRKSTHPHPTMSCPPPLLRPPNRPKPLHLHSAHQNSSNALSFPSAPLMSARAGHRPLLATSVALIISIVGFTTARPPFSPVSRPGTHAVAVSRACSLLSSFGSCRSGHRACLATVPDLHALICTRRTSLR